MCDVLYNKQINLVENTVEVEDKSHEEDNGESEELVEDLDKSLDLAFESGLMQYLNFGRKYEAAAVTGDISRLPGKSCLVRQAHMIGTRLFCEEEESISNSSHSEEESIEILKEKPLTLYEKLEKAIYSKTKVLYCSTKNSTIFNKIMKQEMQLFDSTESPHHQTL
ncbi:uncharacterized protein TNCV_3619311 [Trichonephila clavipes]|nr:uncharacterized protein TNCV_3619311 [Trichonephila clavipes]